MRQSTLPNGASGRLLRRPSACEGMPAQNHSIQNAAVARRRLCFHVRGLLERYDVGLRIDDTLNQ
jgi:hypothetical protein